MTHQRTYSVMLIAMLVAACEGAAQHREAVRDSGGDRLTVGTVQREIRVGMSGAEVLKILGSPNIVSSDELRREVWVYDRISTENVYSTSSGGISALVLVGGVIGNTLVGGGAGPSYGRSSGATATSQNTLTIIIKFDGAGRVNDFAYHTSRF